MAATPIVLELQQPEVSYNQESSVEQNNEIVRHDATQLSYNDFFWNYIYTNQPVILTGVSTDWECRLNWTLNSNINDNVSLSTDNSNVVTAVNFDYLKNKIGNCTVPVADCSQEYYNSHAKREMRFYDFLHYWEAKIDATRTEEPFNQNASEPGNNATTENLYLKDWHLKAQMPEYDFYKVPKYFASDWLNEQLVTSGRDDYRFVYMGPTDSWTPFHADVFGSYSWSTNIAGCKMWLLLPPGEELKLADRLGNLPFRIDETQLERNEIKYFKLHQRADEAIFVPSGWYHQVWNITDTISVNHNWFNACNVKRIWQNLCSNMQKVITEIDDCREMDNFNEHCQMMLRASFGMNYLDFLDMLEFIANQRLSCCNNGNAVADEMSSNTLFFGAFKPNDFHIRYDLKNIGEVLNMMLRDTVVCDSRAVLYRRCLQLMELLKGF